LASSPSTGPAFTSPRTLPIGNDRLHIPLPLLIQNFLIAVIVEDYMAIKQAIEEHKVVKEFWTDVHSCIVGIFRSILSYLAQLFEAERRA